MVGLFFIFCGLIFLTKKLEFFNIFLPTDFWLEVCYRTGKSGDLLFNELGINCIVLGIILVVLGFILFFFKDQVFFDFIHFICLGLLTIILFIVKFNFFLFIYFGLLTVILFYLQLSLIFYFEFFSGFFDFIHFICLRLLAIILFYLFILGY